MLVSVGLLAVVGIIPLSIELLRPELSVSSGGFRRRTSSRKSCLILDPRAPSHPDPGTDDFLLDTAMPAADLP